MIMPSYGELMPKLTLTSFLKWQVVPLVKHTYFSSGRIPDKIHVQVIQKPVQLISHIKMLAVWPNPAPPPVAVRLILQKVLQGHCVASP